MRCSRQTGATGVGLSSVQFSSPLHGEGGNSSSHFGAIRQRVFFHLHNFQVPTNFQTWLGSLPKRRLTNWPPTRIDDDSLCQRLHD